MHHPFLEEPTGMVRASFNLFPVSKMNTSLFMRLSSQVTVADLLTPLQVSVPAGISLEEAVAHVNRLGSSEGQFCLVLDGGKIVGQIEDWLLRGRAESGDNGEPTNTIRIRDCMHEIDPSRLLTADTPARRALQLVAKSDPFAPWFVLDGHEFVGTLDYDCFFKPAFKVCLFALVMQLEQRSLWLCAQEPKASWESLSEGRRNKAIDEMNRKRRPPSGLGEDVDEALRTDPAAKLGYTMFIDKKTILRKCRLIPEITDDKLEQVFNSMECLRNFCAHPDTFEEPFIEPQDLLEQITSCEKVLRAIEERLLPDPPVGN